MTNHVSEQYEKLGAQQLKEISGGHSDSYNAGYAFGAFGRGLVRAAIGFGL